MHSLKSLVGNLIDAGGNIKQIIKKSRKFVRKTFSSRRNKLLAALASISILVGGVYAFSINSFKVAPSSYQTLLQTIARGESGGNYNAYYGNATNSEIKFTEMTIAEVQNWQTEYVESGSYSSAVGKYQIIRPTLTSLVAELSIDQAAVFSEALQDRLAIALIERRGVTAYINGEIGRDQFANNLSQEWAALPKIIGEEPQESYYASDGVNKARIQISAIYDAISKLRPV